jgi:hypothetical protein
MPIVFSIGIAARRPVPNMTFLSGALPTSSRDSAATVWERSDLFAKETIQALLLRESGKGGRFALELSGPRNFLKPDLIVYWLAGGTKITDSVPNTALLLGAFGAGPLFFPTNQPAGDGFLLLYSLADQEIIAYSKPFPLS